MNEQVVYQQSEFTEKTKRSDLSGLCMQGDTIVHFDGIIGARRVDEKYLATSKRNSEIRAKRIDQEEEDF